MEFKPVVKYDDKWWLLDKINDNGTVTLWRNGQPAIIPKELINIEEVN